MRKFGRGLIVSVAAAAACDKISEPAPQPAPAVVAVPAIAAGPASFLTVSDSNGSAGAIVVVAGNVVSENAHDVASFRAHVRYDAALLEFVDEAPVPGMMRAVNPLPDRVVVAGASTAAMSDTRLFALRFRVRTSRGLGELALVVDELNDTGYASRLNALKALSAVRVDASLQTLRLSAPK